MKLPIFFFAVLFTCTAIATDDQIMAKEPISFHGVIARKPSGGYLTCTVAYNKETNTYSGKEYNCGYSPLEWTSQPLRAFDAKRYFKQFLHEAAQAQAAATHKK